MPFDSGAYGAQVAEILRLIEEGDGTRAAALIRENGAAPFAGSRAPEAALAGLYLRAGCWREAHETAQEIDTREGSYWHAIVHREEPDAGNSAYWFGQTGEHPIFPALAEAAAQAGFRAGAKWNPLAFIALCEEARSRPGSERERQAREISRAEWQLLFDWCARKNAPSAPSSTA